MKWKPATAHDHSSRWQEAEIGWGDSRHNLIFVVEERRQCWAAFYMVAGTGDDAGIGEYRTERMAKAACRRKAGAMIRRMIRDMQA